jgi:hypothetical protein
MIPRNL